MHIRKFLSAIIFGTCFVVSANAATKCVALDSSTTCTGTPTSGKVDWSATCNSIPITGVAVCSSTPGSSTGQTVDSIATENTTDANKYCWCKMTSPAVSRFVFAENLGSSTNCSDGCAYNCAYLTTDYTSFRAGLFSGLTN